MIKDLCVNLSVNAAVIIGSPNISFHLSKDKLVVTIVNLSPILIKILVNSDSFSLYGKKYKQIH